MTVIFKTASQNTKWLIKVWLYVYITDKFLAILIILFFQIFLFSFSFSTEAQQEELTYVN